MFAWKLWQKNWVYSGTCGIPCRTHNFTKCRWQGARQGGLMALCCELLWAKTKACRISRVVVLSLGNNLASSSDENCQLLYKVPPPKIEVSLLFSHSWCNNSYKQGQNNCHTDYAPGLVLGYIYRGVKLVLLSALFLAGPSSLLQICLLIKKLQFF